MDIRVQSKLEEIGRQFDLGLSPLRWQGGVIEPNDPENPLVWNQEVPNHVPKQTSKPRGSEARSWQRPTGRERQAYGPWTPSPYPKGFSQCGLPLYLDQINKVCEEYPGTRVWQQEEGFWLLSTSRLFTGYDRKALFLTAVPLDLNYPVTAWGFWDYGAGVQWIGPKHTNLPHGSICAYEPKEKVSWGRRDLVTHLDLYTDWTVKQLHMEKIGRWPGKQSVPYIYERLIDSKDDELCGCIRDTGLLYRDCCKENDLNSDIIFQAVAYTTRMAGGLRKIPSEIMQFALSRNNPPLVKKYL